MLFSQKAIIAEAKLQAVTLYEHSAQMNSTATVKIPKGSSEIVLTNIAENIDENSIKIGSNGKISILTYGFTEDDDMFEIPLDMRNPEHKKVSDSLNLVRNHLKYLEAEKVALQKSLEVLDKNQTVNAGSHRFANEVEKLADLTLKKRTELSLALRHKEEEITKWDSRKGGLEKRFNRNAAENVSDGKIVMTVTAEQEETVNFTLAYNAENAGWKPFYEINSNGVNEKIQMIYKAVVQQDTGLDWKNISLNLVSGFPNRSHIAPTIRPWQIYYREMMTYGPLAAPAAERASMSKVSADEVSGVTVSAVRNSAFQNQLNVGYELTDKYTILSNSNDHSINLDVKEIPATYTYFAIPKYDRTAYLTAEIDNLDKYSLVAAEANVVFENTNVGKTMVNPDTEDGKLRITLGDDRRISLKRQLIKDENSAKNVSATNREQQFAYEITVRNNRSERISLTLQDQVPISTDKQIAISLTSKGAAEYDENTGVLTWKLNLGANETTKIRFGYKVNYLKNKVVMGL